ncbi:hypothetical protein BpHYR1_021494 [Brachionus plicatilis]|uniref:Uncharacterized protein n=1 Tax=Brachionus plicatilis TaxID=10195 RepID=A0A3M7T2U1_BRAPC|nr:hypothetical protein BpHYR1_021494 [Brachionus plicatilis]
MTSFAKRENMAKKHTEQKITTSKLAKEYNKLDFDKFAYVSIDSNLAARGMLLEAEIVDSIATNNPVEQDSDAEIAEQQDANKQVINSKEATDRINELKQFFLTNKDDNSNKILYRIPSFNYAALQAKTCKLKYKI